MVSETMEIAGCTPETPGVKDGLVCAVCDGDGLLQKTKKTQELEPLSDTVFGADASPWSSLDLVASTDKILYEGQAGTVEVEIECSACGGQGGSCPETVELARQFSAGYRLLLEADFQQPECSQYHKKCVQQAQDKTRDRIARSQQKRKNIQGVARQQGLTYQQYLTKMRRSKFKI